MVECDTLWEVGEGDVGVVYIVGRGTKMVDHSEFDSRARQPISIPRQWLKITKRNLLIPLLRDPIVEQSEVPRDSRTGSAGQKIGF